MKDDTIRNGQLRANETKGPGRIEQHEFGSAAGNGRFNGPPRSSCRKEQCPRRDSQDVESLRSPFGIKFSCTVIGRGGEHREAVRVQAMPEFSQIGLNTAHLWWEVIGDEKVSGHRPTTRRLGAACFEPEPWHKTRLLQEPEPTSFCGIDDDGIVRLSVEQERNDTVATRIGVNKGTAVAVNAQWCCFAEVSVMVTGELHDRSLRGGCDIPLVARFQARH
jgi:hypothetical protein